MEQKSEYIRESAKRMFAKEFNAIRYDIKFDDDERLQLSLSLQPERLLTV